MTKLYTLTGPYVPLMLEGTLASGATDGADAVLHTAAVVTFAAPWPGFVASLSVEATGGNYAGADFRIKVGATVLAPSSLLPGAAARGRIIYEPWAVEFDAGDLLSIRLHAVTTMRATTAWASLIFNVVE